MNSINLSELHNLNTAASPGPWRISELRHIGDGPEIVYDGDEGPVTLFRFRNASLKSYANARLICALRNAASGLLALIQGAREVRRAERLYLEIHAEWHDDPFWMEHDYDDWLQRHGAALERVCRLEDELDLVIDLLDSVSDDFYQAITARDAAIVDAAVALRRSHGSIAGDWDVDDPLGRLFTAVDARHT